MTGSFTSAEESRTIRSFVVRRARLNESHRRAISDLGPQFIVQHRKEHLEPAAVFGGDSGPAVGGRLVLEIGFGMGHATAEYAANSPADALLGIEVYPPGVGKLLQEIERRSLRNVRIIRRDAVDVLQDMIATDALDAVHVFFPDPWPKKRHHKRRLVQPEFLDLVCSRLRSGGYLYLTTDWEDYAQHMRSVVSQESRLRLEDADPEGFSASRSWRPTTSFERKGLNKNHTIRELFLTRL